jgi:predicted thioesterase
MTIKLLASKKLSDMTNEELYELQHSISEIQIERLKINSEKLRKLFQEAK